MSEWESIFGEGVPGDSVIDGINNDYFREQREADAERGRKQREASLAYRSDEEVKTAFLAKLEAATKLGDPITSVRTLESVVDLPMGDFGSLVDTLQIPYSLCELISAFFELARDRYMYTGRNKSEGNNKAVTSLLDFFKAIVPGTDLRFIVPQFNVRLAEMALTKMRQPYTSHKDRLPICEAAFDILCARARGINPPLFLVRKVRQDMSTFVSDIDVESADHVDNPEETLIAAALEERSGSVMLIGADNDIGTVSGEVDARDFWNEYAWDLKDLLGKAPATRLRSIDLNRAFNAAHLIDPGSAACG